MSPTPPRSRTVKLGGLSDLESVKRTLQDQAQQAALAEAQRKLKAQRQQAEEQLFKRAIGAVKPLAHTPRVQLSAALPPPIPVQRQRDEASALQESLSDEMDVSSLLDTDSELSFRAPGVGPDVTRKLRRGVWARGFTAPMARLKSCSSACWRCALSLRWASTNAACWA